MVILNRRILYNTIFDDEKKSPEFYLSQISTITGLRLGSTLIQATVNTQFPLAEPQFVDRWFSEPNRDIATRILECYTEGAALLNVYSSLKFNEIVLSLSVIEEGAVDASVEVLILKAYLALNDEQQVKEANCVQQLQSEIENDEEKVYGFIISISYPDNDVVNYDTRIVLASQIYKATEFFKYLESNNLNNHLQLFLDKYGVESWQEWLKNYYAFVMPLTRKEYQGSFYDVLLEPEGVNYEKNLQFIETLSLGSEEDYSLQDFIKMRSNPLVKVEENKYQVVYQLFAMEKMFKSIVFEFSLEINRALPKAQQISNFRSEFCGNFSEYIVLYKVLKDSFPKKWVHLSGQDFVDNGYVSEPDYYLRFKNKLFLFESKDVVLTGGIKQSRDYLEIGPALKKKLWYEDKQKKTVSRSIRQLVQMIRDSQHEKYVKLDGENNLRHCKYYPIIVCHDRQFDSLGVNSLIAYWWQEELSEAGLDGVRDRIKRPVILNIDNLIAFQDLLKSRTVSLENIIEEYWRMIDQKRNGTSWLENIDTEQYQTFISFSDFLQNSISKKGIWKIPKFILPYGSEVFK